MQTSWLSFRPSNKRSGAGLPQTNLETGLSETNVMRVKFGLLLALSEASCAFWLACPFRRPSFWIERRLSAGTEAITMVRH